MDFVTPSGFRDVLTDEAQRRETIQRTVQECFASNGYLPLETPTLEVYDVMSAGGRIPGSPFKFFDSQGDLLAMRPDVTVQVARMCATRLGNQPGPFRFRYAHRVFRESGSEMQAAAREMKQIGLELIGETGAQADAELISLLDEALALSGVKEYTLAMATVSVLRSLIDASGAPEWWCDRVLNAFHDSDFIELDRLTCPESLALIVSEEGIELGEDEVRSVCPPVYARAISALPRIRGGREAIDQVRDLVAPLG